MTKQIESENKKDTKILLENIESKLADLERNLEKYESERSHKVQAWKKKTRQLIAS